MSTKTFASGVTFRLGLMNLIADAVPVKRTGADKETAFALVCPVHTTSRPSQKYECTECDKIYEPSELARAKQVEDGKLRPMAEGEIEAVKEAGIDPGYMELNICPASDLEAATTPSGQTYRLRLGKDKRARAQLPGYTLLRALVADPSVAIYGVCRLNSKCTPTPFRVVSWRNQLTLQALIRPSDLTEPEVIEGEPDADMLTMGRKLLDALSAPFNADLLANEGAKKLAEILEADTTAVAASAGTAPPTDAPDLMELLAASLKSAA